MVKYLKTRKGQFYKVLKNGKKKRITQKEYKKKKTRKMIGGTLEGTTGASAPAATPAPANKMTYYPTLMAMDKAHSDPSQTEEQRMKAYRERYASLEPQAPPKPKGTFMVDVLRNANGDKVFKCLYCNNISGTGAPKNPNDTSLFAHKADCPNQDKIPVPIFP